MVGNRAVEDGLSERRLVRFVVAVATVADDVDDSVGGKLLTILERNFRGENDGIWIIAVDV